MKAAVLHAINQPLTIEEVSLQNPGPREVLIRTAVAGICHSDLHFADGAYPHPLPCVLGHESAGIVEAVGDDVTYVKPGDHVVTCLSVFCGYCDQCITGHPSLCQSAEIKLPPGVSKRLSWKGGLMHQFLNLSSYAEQMLVHEHALAKIRPDMPLDRAALIGCGVLTGVGAVFHTAKVEPGTTVAVIGCGGVGLAVIQGARLAGAVRIVAVDVLPEKLALAAELGATDTVDASIGDAVAQVRELTDGVDYSFSAITPASGLVDAVRMCAYGGTATLVGVPPPGRALEVDVERDLFHPKVAIAVTHGGDTIPQEDFPFLAEAALDGRLDLDRFVTKTISLDEAADALDELRDAPAGIRTVVLL
jgi:S-(hydroxymethyl)glutathione dehydrogenase / alcohol dehydrogenase